jgi:hypothetical protein
LLEQAAWIVAKINDITFEVGADLLLEILDGFLYSARCLFIEGGDAYA